MPSIVDICRGLAKSHTPKLTGLGEGGVASMMRHSVTRFGSGWQGLGPEYSIDHQRMGPKEYFAVLKKGEENVGYMGYNIRPGGVLEQGPMEIFTAHKGQKLGQGLMTEIMKKAKGEGAITFRSDPMGLSEEMVNFFQAGQRKGVFTEFAEDGKRAYRASLLTLDKTLATADRLVSSAHLAPRRTAQIEGLGKGMASISRKVLTSFGSPWRGPGEEKVAKDSFERVLSRNMTLDASSLESYNAGIDKLWEVAKPHVTGPIKFLGGGQESSVLDLGEHAFKVGWGGLHDPKYSKVEEVLQPISRAHLNTEAWEAKGGMRAEVFPKVDTNDVSLTDLYAMTDTMAAKGVEWEPHMGNIGRDAAGKVKVIDVGIPIKTATDRDREWEQLFGPFSPKPWESELANTEAATVGELVKATRNIMDSGEGAAIAKAGTSCVPAVLKRTSRMIKNAL